jgi:Protein of unknown function (DUF4230)
MKKLMNRNVPLLGTLVLVVLVVLVVLIGFAGLGVAGLFDITNPFQSRTTDRSQPALLTSIQDISQFHAAVGNFEVVLDVEHDVDWVPGFIAGERSLFVAAGTVNAYVDFSGLAERDFTLSVDGKSVKIRLPDAKLDMPNLDQDRTYLFSQERGVVNRYRDALSVQDQSELYQLAEQKLVSAAEKSELAQQAQENTRAMLTGLFKSLDIAVSFTDDARKEIAP